ncbi:SGNH/GDSL hydrolase family protein [Nocardioides sp. zg-579]|uniref:SGNH/GDSL hydrolase family protein n=1 Tax=Nocardioides marmotae TaxID=2663857 RepID=A0A6I3JF38_9ACTN|nr:SGNH/GDSL hydrolase family protein [Nocardioides marmotae]MCR6033033.1 SGNH/GDSL hydrolase family protein [Gordonia jinghuaiqii]MTB96685.1 SGNH/GDSL hydrolase family protein [Nocardioides marmotae]QKE03100.1 SGNH/GDSL hydrolase family protein [Nocardioides marmotae]
MPRRTTRSLASLASLSAVSAAFLVAGAGPGAAAPAGPTYVALGDSYASAAGVEPVDPTAPVECQRSSRNYPHVLAARTGAALTDVTCGGADTSHFRTSQHPGVAPQLDALSASTTLVTVTIGGNDGGVFGDAIRECSIAGFSTGGAGSPCRDANGSAYEDIVRDATYPALVQALTDVRERAPRAQVGVLGYPWILPAEGSCFGRMPVAEGDVPYLRGLQATLNDAVRRAAEATGATYVDLAGVSEGHDACQPAGTRWIEPVFGGTNPVVVHPNAFGEEQMPRPRSAPSGCPSPPPRPPATGCCAASTASSPTSGSARTGRGRCAARSRPSCGTPPAGATSPPPAASRSSATA